MSDIDDAMNETQSKAKSKFGVGDDSGETDDTDSSDSSKPSKESDGSNTTNSTDTPKTEDSSESTKTADSINTSKTENSSKSSNASKTSKTADAADKSGTEATENETETPNDEPATSDRGRLVDERVNINIYVTEEMRDELDFLYKQMDLEYTETTGDGLAKNWDFYPAVVRTVLRNKDDLRDELGIND